MEKHNIDNRTYRTDAKNDEEMDAKTGERLLTVKITRMENEEDVIGSLEDNINSDTKEEADKTANSNGEGAEKCQAYFGK